jgi:hypothetical protein
MKTEYWKAIGSIQNRRMTEYWTGEQLNIRQESTRLLGKRQQFRQGNGEIEKRSAALQ